MAPCVLILEVVLLNRRFSPKHYASIAVVCIGVAICTTQDLQVTPGTSWRTALQSTAQQRLESRR